VSPAAESERRKAPVTVPSLARDLRGSEWSGGMALLVHSWPPSLGGLRGASAGRTPRRGLVGFRPAATRPAVRNGGCITRAGGWLMTGGV
jgi:hypothetical protein